MTLDSKVAISDLSGGRLKVTRRKLEEEKDDKEEMSDNRMESPRNPLALLPEECWEHIFAWMGNPADLLNCSRTCKLWNDILDSKKTDWLFPAVFSNLVTSFGHHTLLTCRQVSKSWKDTIDRHLEQDQFELSDPTGNGVKFLTAIKLDFARSVDPKLKLERLKLDFGDSARNPIPSRTVSVRAELNYAGELLRKFGDHVWHLLINASSGLSDDPELTAIGLITTVRELLVHTPNLRTLMLSDMNYVNCLKEQVEDGTFHRFYTENPLPPLPHLRSLVMSPDQRVAKESTSFESQFISTYAPRLQTLEICQNDHISLPGAAPNLTYLSCEIKSIADMDALANLNSPRLQVLKVSVNGRLRLDGVHLWDLFWVTKRFGATLTVLEIHFDRRYGEDGIEFPCYSNCLSWSRSS